MGLNFNIHYGPDAAIAFTHNKEIFKQLISGASYSNLKDATIILNTFEEINRLFKIKSKQDITVDIHLFRKDIDLPDISTTEATKYIITLTNKSTRITAIESYADMIYRFLFRGSSPYFLDDIKHNLRTANSQDIDFSKWSGRNLFVRTFTLAVLNSMIDEESIEYVNTYQNIQSYVPYPVNKTVAYADFSEIFINLMIKSIDEDKLSYQDSVDKILWQNGTITADFFKIPYESGILSSDK